MNERTKRLKHAAKRTRRELRKKKRRAMRARPGGKQLILTSKANVPKSEDLKKFEKKEI